LKARATLGYPAAPISWGRWWALSRRDLVPGVWLLIGLLVSYEYTGALSPIFALTLPLPLFPQQAVILSVLLLTPVRTWWLYLLIYFVVQVADGVWTGLPTRYALLSNVADVIEPLIGAALMRRYASLPPRFAQLREVGLYMASVSAAAAVGATIGAAVRWSSGFGFVVSWQSWFLADVIASLVLAPVIVIWATRGLRDVRLASRSRVVEAAALGLSLLMVGGLVFTAHPTDLDTAPALLYLTVPILVWAAVRFGPQVLLTALAAVTVMAIMAAANDVGPFLGRPAPADVFMLQIFLLGVGMPLWLLSALVSERQEAQVRLSQSEERYRVMVRSLPRGAVLLFGPDLRHQFADGQGLADVGLTKEAIEGHTLSEVFPSDIAATLEPRYRAALAGRPESFELTHDGRQYQMDALPIADAASPTAMLVVHDVTDRKRAELLTELDRSRTAFFGNISHELRTPLTVMLGPLHDALANGSLQDDALRMVYRNALRLQRLVNALLDVSRAEAGRLNPSYELTDVAALTAELTESFRPVVERAGLSLVVDTPPLPADMAVSVDPDMWEKVVLNLVSNAFNHTFEGEIRVALRASADRRHLHLRVRDTGVGIAPSEQARIFDRFHQVRGARARSQEGTGIGLALVQELVELQGGSVAVESAEGVGSTFTVSLPLGPAAPYGAGAPDRQASAASRAAPFIEEAEQWLPGSVPSDHATDASPVPARRVLVADDNPDMRRYVASILGAQWRVQTVADGPATLQAVREQPPDLLLLDVMMPGLDGFQVLAALRADAATRQLPVIMLSARAGEDAAVEGLVAGANDYVVKPFGSAELSARVRTQIAAALARSEAEAAVRARDEFVAIVVHDLRHPLATINWHVQILRRCVRLNESLTSGELGQLLEAVEAGVQTLSAQIDELHDATLLKAGRPLHLQLGPTDLVQLVRRAVEEQQQASDGARLEFESSVDALNGIWDARRLSLVMANLLSNAVKYSASGSPIAVRVARADGLGVVSVEDHGIGIPAADLPHLFERYWRGSNVTGHIAGSGLGLAGARGIVDQHGGTIAVESVEGEGSRFTMRLPLAPA
jgi:PAS domain S-box-containing protein